MCIKVLFIVYWKLYVHIANGTLTQHVITCGQNVERGGKLNGVTCGDHSWLMCMSEQFHMLIKSMVFS